MKKFIFTIIAMCFLVSCASEINTYYLEDLGVYMRVISVSSSSDYGYVLLSDSIELLDDTSKVDYMRMFATECGQCSMLYRKERNDSTFYFMATTRKAEVFPKKYDLQIVDFSDSAYFVYPSEYIEAQDSFKQVFFNEYFRYVYNLDPIESNNNSH